MATVDSETLNEASKNDALGQGCDQGAVSETMVPEGHAFPIAKTELESHAAENQREQHHEDWKIDGRHDDREGERKRREKARPAKYQPGLVAIPDRRDRVHHQVALRTIAGKRVENTDAEIKAVQQNIQEDTQADKQCPDGD